MKGSLLWTFASDFREIASTIPDVERRHEVMRIGAEVHPMAKAQAKRQKTGRRWSADVTRHSHALDLEKNVFAQSSPERIAASLKHSAETSKSRKADPFRSAMSILTFYINRAGRSLPESRKRILERAKEALRRKFGRA